MTFQIKKKYRLTTTVWSGGTTTQLFIFPPEARYDQRNFLFRVSTAEVKIEQTVFTSLPGFKRKLMLLNGSLAVNHKNQYSKTLNKFEQDEFDGGWETSAIGKVTDFNLMLARGKEGGIEAFFLKAGEEKEINLEKINYAGFYFYKGAAEIRCGDSKIEAEQGDFLSVEEFLPNEKVTIKSKEDSEIASVNVKV